jgi:HEAT repeat protein
VTTAFETFWAYRANGYATFRDGGPPDSSILEMDVDEKKLTEQRLLPLLETPATVDSTAVRALGLLRSQRAVLPLELLLRSSSDVRVEAALALWRCTGSDEPIHVLAAMVFPTGRILRFLRALRRHPPATQLLAVSALAQIASPVALATLTRAAHSERLHPQVASQARVALARTTANAAQQAVHAVGRASS